MWTTRGKGIGIGKGRNMDVADDSGGNNVQKGPSMITNLEVSLADMYTGRTVEVSSPLHPCRFPFTFHLSPFTHRRRVAW